MHVLKNKVPYTYAIFVSIMQDAIRLLYVLMVQILCGYYQAYAWQVNMVTCMMMTIILRCDHQILKTDQVVTFWILRYTDLDLNLYKISKYKSTIFKIFMTHWLLVDYEYIPTYFCDRYYNIVIIIYSTDSIYEWQIMCIWNYSNHIKSYNDKD